jgi:3-isopropylmalate dehydrogenase
MSPVNRLAVVEAPAAVDTELPVTLKDSVVPFGRVTVTKPVKGPLPSTYDTEPRNSTVASEPPHRVVPASRFQPYTTPPGSVCSVESALRTLVVSVSVVVRSAAGPADRAAAVGVVAGAGAGAASAAGASPSTSADASTAAVPYRRPTCGRRVQVARRGDTVAGMTDTLRLAVIPGDGIGTEVVAEGLKVLDAALGSDVSVEATEYDLGARRYHATGETLPDSVVAELRGYDAILLGAIGDPTVPPGVLERGVLLPLRFALDHHVNLRPVKLFPGVASPLAGKGPEDIDFVVCREGTEGPYAGAGGFLRQGTPHEVATEVSLNTRYGAERIIRDAFARAGRRRGKVTLVHKTNVLVHAGSLWQRTFDAVAAEYPDIETDYCHVDAASMFFLTQPERFDVVVTDNLFGDILTDIGAAIAGGIGLAASGNLDPSRTNPSMFEPVHGSAPDIAGQGKADPTATVLSVAMLLDHVGYADAAARVEAGVAADLAERGTAARSTSQIGDALARRVAG